MSREIYKRSVAPHQARVMSDAGVPTDKVPDFINLMRYYESQKDYIKLMYFPALTGNKIRVGTSAPYPNFVSKGYSANSIQQEIGNTNYWNLGVVSIAPGASSVQLNNLTAGKQYIVTAIKNYNVAINFGDGWIRFTNSEKIVFKTNQFWCVFMNLDSTNTYSFTPEIREYIPNDLTQTISTSQPYLSGNIAPTEIPCIKNPNGGGNYLTHPTISFSANDSWSVTTVLNWNGSSNIDLGYAGGGYRTRITFDLNLQKIGLCRDGDLIMYFDSLNVKNQGKNVIVTITKISNIVSLFINGVFKESKEYLSASFVFSNLLATYNNNTTTPTKIYHHIIYSKALTPQEVTEEHTLLRSFIPEIESVQIGTQTWATSNCEMAATPQGNIIAEMQAAANVEKITNVADREFSSDTGWWDKSPSNSQITISGGVCNIATTSVNKFIFRSNITSNLKYYKVTVTVLNYVSGGVQIWCGTNQTPTMSSNGVYTYYVQSDGDTRLIIFATTSNTVLSIDNISVQEIGWTGSQELYDGIYAQTSGTVEQKTYAAVKAAAMWCHYGGSGAAALDNGAIYGKLYNWFAVKLLQMDIDYYNAANPTALWGWRVPTQSDFNTLATTLGGVSVAGGKMKMTGTAYWNSPNTGATNESGFSAIGGGSRETSGSFGQFNIRGRFYTVDNYINDCVNTDSTFYSINISALKSHGDSLRLIKS